MSCTDVRFIVEYIHKVLTEGANIIKNNEIKNMEEFMENVKKNELINHIKISVKNLKQ